MLKHPKTLPKTHPALFVKGGVLGCPWFPSGFLSSYPWNMSCESLVPSFRFPPRLLLSPTVKKHHVDSVNAWPDYAIFDSMSHLF